MVAEVGLAEEVCLERHRPGLVLGEPRVLSPVPHHALDEARRIRGRRVPEGACDDAGVVVEHQPQPQPDITRHSRTPLWRSHPRRGLRGAPPVSLAAWRRKAWRARDHARRQRPRPQT